MENPTTVEAQSDSRGGRRVMTGWVVGDKMNRTIVVRVERRFRHRLYGKVLTRHKQYMVHDPKSQAKIGDKVQIQESRPYSKNKHFILRRILAAAAQGVSEVVP